MDGRVVHEGEAAEGARALGLQRARQGVELLARQPLAQLIERAAAVVADRLQGQVVNLGPRQGDLFLSGPNHSRAALRGAHFPPYIYVRRKSRVVVPQRNIESYQPLPCGLRRLP